MTGTRYITFAMAILLPLCCCKAQGMEQEGKRPLKIGVIVAMEKELRQLQNYWSAEASAPIVVVRQCGIGKVNAALGCAELIREERPDVIISMGCAGGCGEGVHVGDVVVATETAYHDLYCGIETEYGQVQGLPARFLADKSLEFRAESLEFATAIPSAEGTAAANSKLSTLNSKLKRGLIVTGDWFVDTKEKMQEIVDHFPDAMAVDMESAAIAHTCYKYGVPFISMRIISDVPLSDEHASQYTDFWETVSDQTFSICKDYVEALLKNTNKK